MAKRSHPQRRQSPAPLSREPRSALTVQNPRAAGIDIHDSVHWVAVPPDRDPEPVRRFDAFTADLEALADWLTECGVDTVAMESTGVVLRSPLRTPRERGFKVYLVNARAVAKVDGRPKTDIHDCQWIQRLHSYGLLEKAFRPEDDIVVLRIRPPAPEPDLVCFATHPAHAEGLGGDEPQADPGCQRHRWQDRNGDHQGHPGWPAIRSNWPSCRRALEADRGRDRQGLKLGTGEGHLLTLRQAVELYEFYHLKIAECDRTIDGYLSRLPNGWWRRATGIPACEEQEQRQRAKVRRPETALRDDGR